MEETNETICVGIDLGTSRSSVSTSNGERHVVDSYVGFVTTPVLLNVNADTFAAHLAWQIKTLDIRDGALCLRLFKSNRDAGLLLFAGLLVDAVLRA